VPPNWPLHPTAPHAVLSLTRLPQVSGNALAGQNRIKALLEFAPIYRPGERDGHTSRTERWTWDFVVEGASVRRQITGELVGVLGWNEPSDVKAVAKLLGEAPADLAPNRVALYVCPECGDLACGALTAAVTFESGSVVWSDLAWENGLDDDSGRRRYDIGPFRFERSEYERALRAVVGRNAAPRGQAG
jgi:hypothetical protein